jgi:NAD(P)-dependent dehydrogenase (short-subunit alcohol dehydrogenase family)
MGQQRRGVLSGARQTRGKAMTTKDVLGGGVAVITGAASGIGEGLARVAAELGMKLVLADIAADRLKTVVDEIAAGGTEVLPVPTDVSDPAALDRLAEATYGRFGEVRLLINNAGIETLGLAWELSAAQWNRIVNINVLGVVHGVRAFAGRMVAAGKPAFISNVASVGGLSIMPVQTPYILSKHAVLAFTECLSLEMDVQKAPIKVSAVLPGPVATRIFQDAPGGANPKSVDYHRAVMDQMITQHGMTGVEAGKLILDQIAAGEFWVSPHPEMMRETAARRSAHLAALTRPALAPGAQALLGD